MPIIKLSKAMLRYYLISLVALLYGAVVSSAVAADIYPVVRVNDEYITNFDIKQKIKLLQFNNGMSSLSGKASPHIVAQIIDNYILERLILQQFNKTNTPLSTAEIDNMVASLEKQNNLSRGDLYKTLLYHGIDRKYFTDQLVAGSLWQSMLHGYVNEQIRSISDVELMEYYLSQTTQPNWLYHIKVVEFASQYKPTIEAVLVAEHNISAEQLQQQATEQYKAKQVKLYDRGWRPVNYLETNQWHTLIGQTANPQPSYSNITCGADSCQVAYLQQVKLSMNNSDKSKLIAGIFNPLSVVLSDSYKAMLKRNSYVEILNEYRP